MARGPPDSFGRIERRVLQADRVTDLMYFVEAVTNGGGRTVPDLEQEMPYVIVPVER